MATTVISSEVDYVAAYLASINAPMNGVQLDVLVEANPQLLPRSGITTCEIPTHIPGEASDSLIRGLAARAADGVVLVAVHSGIAARYERLFREGGVTPQVALQSGTHVVLAMNKGGND